VVGAERFFHQGLGFAGPSGFIEIGQAPFAAVAKTESGNAPSWFVESYTVAALCGNGGETIALGALDHRDFCRRPRCVRGRSGVG
jgi:hypothetical protein